MKFSRKHIVPLIFGILMGTIGTMLGMFIGLQVWPPLANLLLFPGLLISIPFGGIGHVQHGMLIVMALQIAWWFLIFTIIRNLIQRIGS